MTTEPKQQTWKERAITHSEIITDAWEVTKIYCGRAAEWVLFGCMMVNIVEILPNVGVPLLLSTVVLGVQAITLDIAGFSLASMADHARTAGDEKAANKATWTGYFLIGLMIVTVSLITIGLLWPQVKAFTDLADKGLILIRVVMTVIYGHVVHGLRRETAAQPHLAQDQMEAITTTFHQHIQQLAVMQENVQEQLTASRVELASAMQVQLATELAVMQEQLAKEIAREKRGDRPVLHALPAMHRRNRNVARSAASQDGQAEKFDARAFVFSCLQKQPDCKLADMRKWALASGQDLSESSISRYRKQYYASAEMQGASPDASSIMQDADTTVRERMVATHE